MTLTIEPTVEAVAVELVATKVAVAELVTMLVGADFDPPGLMQWALASPVPLPEVQDARSPDFDEDRAAALFDRADDINVMMLEAIADYTRDRVRHLRRCRATPRGA